MSEYAYVTGWYQFQNTDALEEALEKLAHGGWLDEALDEDEIVDRDALTIHIPHGHYRNLHRHLDTIGKTAEEYHLVSDSADGYLMGWIDTHDSSDEIDLEEWAADRDFPDEPDDFEERVEWEEDILAAFLNENQVEPPAAA